MLSFQDFESNDILNGSYKAQTHQKNAEALGVVEPRSPEDVYKTHLIESKRLSIAFSFIVLLVHSILGLPGIDAQPQIDGKLENLAKTFVSAFVNCGYGTDNLILKESQAWVFRHSDIGITCAVASMGLLYLWDTDQVNVIDTFLYNDQPYAKAGAILGYGLSLNHHPLASCTHLPPFLH